MDVRIGIIQSAKELDVELSETEDRDKIIKKIENALGEKSGVLWLTDKRGRQVAISSEKIAYVELGAADADRRVGFGAP